MLNFKQVDKQSIFIDSKNQEILVIEETCKHVYKCVYVHVCECMYVHSSFTCNDVHIHVHVCLVTHQFTGYSIKKITV